MTIKPVLKHFKLGLVTWILIAACKLRLIKVFTQGKFVGLSSLSIHEPPDTHPANWNQQIAKVR